MNQKKIERLALRALLFSYIIIIIPIILFQYKLVNFLSIEWLFLPFVLSGLIFYFFRIDSRYFILSAVLLLGLCPFLLIYGLEKNAEATATYIYYFLVIGILLRILEFKFNYKEHVGLETIAHFWFNHKMIYFSVFWAILFICSYIFNLANTSKAMSLYLSIAFLIIYYLKFLTNKEF